MSHKKEKNDILDVVNPREGWFRDVVKDVTKRSTAQQVAIGGASGWWVICTFIVYSIHSHYICSALTMRKFGRTLHQTLTIYTCTFTNYCNVCMVYYNFSIY